MSWKGILGKAGVTLTGPNGANNWTFEGMVHARNIISRFAGQHFHVDSGHDAASDSAKYGLRKEKPFATIEYAIGQCTANDSDVIWVHAGHIEAVVAAGGLNPNVEGITIVFLGNGDDQAKITFGTDVDADMDIDADNITLINPRFETAIDALTGPIDINKANFAIYNGEYYDAAGKAAIDCIVTDANAIGLTIDGWKYFESTTGTQKQSNLQLDGVDNLTLKNIDVRGDFATGNLENVTDELLNVRLEDIYFDNLNASPVPCMVLDPDCDGFAKNVSCRIASGTTYLSDASDINWGQNCLGYNADGGAGDPLGTVHTGGIEGKIDIIDEYHDVPAKDNSLNAQLNEVIGNKTDTGAAGTVTETDTLVAYIKQLVTDAIAATSAIGTIDGLHDVPVADAATNLYLRDVVGIKTDAAINAVTTTKTLMAYLKGVLNEITVAAQNNTNNAFINDVIGQKTDTGAEGAVTTTDTLVGYIKQLVTDAIAATAAISTVDGLHDVPVADASTNMYVRDVVGIKTDAAAEGTVSSVESLMAYVKQSVTLAIARDTALGVVDGLHDVPIADAATNLYMRDVVGIKTDAAAEGDVSAVESLMAYAKQLVTAAITEAAATAAGVPQTAIKATGDMTGMDSGEVLFTVTGDVLVKVGSSVDVAVTSTSGTTTVEVGVTGNTACLCIQDALDNAAFAIGDSWTLDTAADANGAAMSSEWVLIGNGVDIILTISADDITAGEMDFYCQFIPVSADGAVVAA